MDYSEYGHMGMSYFRMIWTLVASVGWYVAAVAAVCWYASPYVWEKYTEWKLRKDEQDYAAKYHKNPDLLQERLSALEASRQKMQEEYYQKSLFTRGERKEEKKKKSSKSIDVKDAGHKLGDPTMDFSNLTAKSKSARREYNPLMGDSSRGYRPPKRSCCDKGSCG